MYSFNNFLDAIKYFSFCSIHCMSSFNIKKIELILWQVDLVRVDLVAS